MVGHTYMYSPAVEELRRLVQSGALGRVYYVDSFRANLGIFQKDINVVWDLAPTTSLSSAISSGPHPCASARTEAPTCSAT